MTKESDGRSGCGGDGDKYSPRACKCSCRREARVAVSVQTERRESKAERVRKVLLKEMGVHALAYLRTLYRRRGREERCDAHVQRCSKR